MVTMAGAFRALADANRLRIMAALLRSGRELCICELMDILAVEQYNVSRSVRELRIAGLVTERREGRFVFYSAVRPKTEADRHLFKALGALRDGVLAKDRQRLRERLALREDGRCVVGMRVRNRTIRETRETRIGVPPR